MKENSTLLLVEDDENLGSLISQGLKDSGFNVIWEKKGQDGFDSFKTDTPNLCLLDIMLPDLDGFDLAKKIRSINSEVPILFLTARDLPEDKFKGFESGADDYITKPFLMKELQFRIEVFLKRSQKEESDKGGLQGESWILNQDKLIFHYSGSDHQLTKREFDVLKFFLKNQNRLIPREEILFNIWGDDDYFMGRSLDVFITRLRTIFKSIPEMEIVNVRGVGFRLEIKEEK